MVAIGWGRNSANSNLMENLQFANLVAISNKECKDALIAFYRVSDSEICTFMSAGIGL